MRVLWLLLRRVVWVGLLALCLASLPAQAADIRIVQLNTFDNKHNGSIDVDSGLGFNLGPEGETICNLTLTGPIERGDLDRLKAAVAQHRQDHFDRVPRLCLNSPGGSYGEGLDIAQYLMSGNIGTAVAANAECYSACSLIFMGGTYPWKGQINRFLSTQGTLGFHAPYIPDGNQPPQKVDEAQVREAFTAGIQAMSSFMQLGVGNDVKRVMPELMQEMMAHGPDQFFFVDTVGKAIRFRIGLYDIDKVPRVDDAGICNACVNMNYFALERYGTGGDPDLCNGLPPGRRQSLPKGVRVTNDVAPRGGECSIDLVMSDGLLKQWMYLNDDRNEFGDGLELAYWYLYSPSTKLRDIAAAVRVAAPDIEAQSLPQSAEVPEQLPGGDQSGAAAPPLRPEVSQPEPEPQQDKAELMAQLTQFVAVDYLGEGRPNHETPADLYADQVTYYDKGAIARDRVLADQRSYYRRWPRRTYIYDPSSLKGERGPDDTVDVTFRYTYEVSDGKKFSRGRGVTRLGLALIDGRLLIVRESGGTEK